MDKAEQRRIAYAARNAQPEKDALSAEICRKFVGQPWYLAAKTVLWYVHCRSEVRTLQALERELVHGKRIAIPYCTADADGVRHLGLWRLQAVDELRPGLWNILEPPRERWSETGRQIGIDELDAVMVPGVAFDRQGGRLGNGAGYYDRLLSKVGTDTVLAAVCYESQLLPQITMEAHDVYMDVVITEKTLYSGRRQRDR